MKIRSVSAVHGWQWITTGVLIFRKNPALWIALIAILFVGSRILLLIPFIGILAVLVAPNFLAGLAHGAQALEQGKPLRAGYLLSGFLKNPGRLMVIGAISLAGQLLTLKVIIMLGGDTMRTIATTMGAPGAVAPTPEALSAAARALMPGILAGFLITAPLTMAAWFAPLLIFFDDAKPWPSLVMSFWAFSKNMLAMLVYAIAILIPVVFLTPLSAATRQPDLGFWLLAPILIPSIYVSYKDLFVADPADPAPPLPVTPQ